MDDRKSEISVKLQTRKTELIKEMQEYAYSIHPECHAVNWKHMKSRFFASVKDGLTGQQLKEQAKLLEELKLSVKGWLDNYIQNNEDGIYDAWLEQFWDGECPDEKIIEEYKMARLYEKWVKEGVIEEYYYAYASDEMRESFMRKWNQKYGTPYIQDVELNLYIGQKGRDGKFYCGYDEFYEPLDNLEESEYGKLINRILMEEGS